MVCLACRVLRPSGSGDLCQECRDGLVRGPVRVTPGGVTVSAAFLHQRPARQLVHRLKYEGVSRAAAPLAAGMDRLIEAGAVLVPVPRASVRAIRYGIDPAVALAKALAPVIGGTVDRALAAPLWSRRRAGRLARPDRASPLRRLHRPAASEVYIVDDVVTTGATIDSAAEALGVPVVAAVTATGAAARFPA